MYSQLTALLDETPKPPRTIWPDITAHYDVDEVKWSKTLSALAAPKADETDKIKALAEELILGVRNHDEGLHKIDALLLEYSLDTKEGILLMCLAEALLRVPDSDTADALIEDKIGGADWRAHLWRSDSLFANASTYGLMVAGRVVMMDKKSGAGALDKLVDRLSEPVVRRALREAMKVMGKHFVLGRTIGEALKRSKADRDQGASHSFDMLGEAALTAEDAARYARSYAKAISAIGAHKYAGRSNRPSTISIKLSALHPRYEVAKEARVLTELYDTVLELLVLARENGVGVNIDAEEADRLELSLKLFEKLYRNEALSGWGEFGLVVQAYSKRALPVLRWIVALAADQGDRIPVRLVKGAYWDTEIKKCQQKGLPGYPVYTEKAATDAAYLACARYMLSAAARPHIFPQFATHNAHTVAAIRVMAPHSDYEFQRLNGMGDALYDIVLKKFDVNVCIYAPVGTHKDLLAYLVRRLLENGANSSFVHRLIDADTPVEDLSEHPVETLSKSSGPALPRPRDILPGRKNSRGVNLDIEGQGGDFITAVRAFEGQSWDARPIIAGKAQRGLERRPIKAPFNKGIMAGYVETASAKQVEAALEATRAPSKGWDINARKRFAESLADQLEQNMAELVALCQVEAGKTWQDAIDEVREAVDFCRYYAGQLDGSVKSFSGPNGTSYAVGTKPLGLAVCISPWNFPLAIYLGQIVAALLAGNAVIAKPAEQTPLIAAKTAVLMVEAGLPKSVFSLLPGGGEIGAALTRSPAVDVVAFTGSTATAQKIYRSISEAGSARLIAETGGLNAMIVDSTALPEQVAIDAVRSAFYSAGQRCSSARILYVQDDIADHIIALIKGMMAELSLGDPRDRATDIGPVIDQMAKDKLQAHLDMFAPKIIAQTPLGPDTKNGTFIAPTLIEVSGIAEIGEEQFGPILHVARFKAKDMDKVISEINAAGYGLTLGIQSRIDTVSAGLSARARVGNVYINRDQVGAVVGVQPFGGRGLSGTGPKAGGPHYLPRFAQSVVSGIAE